eukprot:7134555-Prorocentrum_lima.AAC.1
MVKRSKLEVADDTPAKKPRIRMPSTVDTQVQKAICDNFKGFTEVETDGLHVSGMTLRQRIQKDKASNQACKGS